MNDSVSNECKPQNGKGGKEKLRKKKKKIRSKKDNRENGKENIVEEKKIIRIIINPMSGLIISCLHFLNQVEIYYFPY